MNRTICPYCLNFAEGRKVSETRYAYEHCGLLVFGNTPEEAEGTWKRRAPEYFEGRGAR